MEHSKDFETVAKAMSKIDFCMMQTVGEEGINSRPMSNNGEVEYDGDNWFFANRDSAMVSEIEEDDRVHLTFADNQEVSFISVWGTGKIIEDEELKKKLWQEDLRQWFENGPEDPNVVLIKVHAHRIQTWGRVGDIQLDLGDR